MITEFVDLSIQTKGRSEKMRFLITDLGLEDLILGYPWLAEFEPNFSWKDATIETSYLPIIIRSLEWEERTRNTLAGIQTEVICRLTNEPMDNEEKEQIVEELREECSMGATIASELAQKAQQYTSKVEIPEEYQRHAKVFSEEDSKRFPPSRPWDHEIELKTGAPEMIKCKLIPMTGKEDEALRKFLDEELKKGYIKESKSPYASPFFFIKKKDGTLRPIQDY